MEGNAQINFPITFGAIYGIYCQTTAWINPAASANFINVTQNITATKFNVLQNYINTFHWLAVGTIF